MVAQDHQIAGRYHPFHSHLLRNRVTRYRGDPLHVPLLRVQCAPGHRQIVPASVRVGPLQQDDSATLDPSTAEMDEDPLPRLQRRQHTHSVHGEDHEMSAGE
ncbi:MAG TPA: hypothetical protein VKY81_05075 [Natronosporangium sp.]|nr:hypothetical protein [Natronosporangium sp.]